MRVELYCPLCNIPKDLIAVELQPKNDCVHEIDCPNGHRFRANVLYHEFQKLFEVAVNALADNYYREAIGSFAASYERFMELFIRIAMKANDVDENELAKGWKTISRQSERQLGAFVVLFVREFGAQPTLLTNTNIELRNRVVHQGYFPTRDECLKYGRAVLESIRQSIRILHASEKHVPELIRSINDQGDFSPTGPILSYYAHALIATNAPPTEDTKSLDEMLEQISHQRRSRNDCAVASRVPERPPSAR